MIGNRCLYNIYRTSSSTGSRVLNNNNSNIGRLNNSILNGINTPQNNNSPATAGLILNNNSFSTLSSKQFQKIKEKRDAQARLLKEEAEKKFTEANKVSIDPLNFEEALQNLKDKLQKYKVVYANHLATLFKKVETSEQLEEAILFYKSIRNDKPSYFNSSHISQIYYAVDRANQWKLWSDVLINTHTFQIFPSQNVVAKTIYQLLRADQLESALQLMNSHLARHQMSNLFMTTVAKGLKRSGNVQSVVPFLSGLLVNNNNTSTPSPSNINIGEYLLKTILRDAIINNTVEPTLDTLDSYVFIPEDKVGASTVLAAIIAAGLNQHRLVAQFNQSNVATVEDAAKQFTTQFQLAAPEIQEQLKQNVENYFNQSVPESFKQSFTITQSSSPKQEEQVEQTATSTA